MIDGTRLRSTFEALGLAASLPALLPLIERRSAADAHGDLPRWREQLEALPRLTVTAARLDADVVSATGPASDIRRQELSAALAGLSPWRKGPFELFGVYVDAEWRSFLKWNRLRGGIAPLAGRTVLDVGCGNGYFAFRIAGAGARYVLGVDPTLLHVAQFQAIRRYIDVAADVLPLRLAELPPGLGPFDTVFSMGVLYHQRSPIDHLRELKSRLRAGGQLVLETLFLPGDRAFAQTPERRYARMRNVWLLPSLPELATWLDRTGFRDASVVDCSVTTVDEQRATDWMPFDSLAEALARDDPELTIEGWPRPRRVVITASAP